MQTFLSRKHSAAVSILSIVLLLAAPGLVAADESSATGDEPERPFVVRGEVTAESGRPLAAVVVRAFEKRLREEVPLGQTSTDDRGKYSIGYGPEQLRDPDDESPNLVVRGFSIGGTIALAESDVRHSAGPDEVINLVVPDPLWSETLEQDMRDQMREIQKLAEQVRRDEISFEDYIAAVGPKAERIELIERERRALAAADETAPGDAEATAPERSGAAEAEDPAQELMLRYQQASQRLIRALQPMVKLMQDGHVSPEEFGKLMERHQERLERTHEELGPKMAELTEHMRSRILAQLGQEHEPLLTSDELAEIRRVVDNAAAELESAARTLERAAAGLRGLSDDNQD